jgi:cytoskeletal protein RodZ
MEKFSQLLKELDKQSNQRNEDIEELARRSFKILNKNLIDLFSTSQEKINNSILEKNEIVIEEIKQKLEAMETKQRNQNIMKYLTVLVVGILIGIGIYYLKVKDNWIVPKQMKHSIQEGKKFIKAERNQIQQNGKDFYIQITE